MIWKGQENKGRWILPQLLQIIPLIGTDLRVLTHINLALSARKSHVNVSNNVSAVVAGISVIEYRDGAWIKYMWWIHVIGLIWISEFILACQQMVVASSVATWYFSRYLHLVGQLSTILFSGVAVNTSDGLTGTARP